MAVIRFDKEKGWLEATVSKSGGGGANSAKRLDRQESKGPDQETGRKMENNTP